MALSTEDHSICEQKNEILLPPTDDDTDIAFRMHNTHTHPFLQESRSFGGLRIRFNRILHQQEGEQSFQFLLSEMPSQRRKRKKGQ